MNQSAYRPWVGRICHGTVFCLRLLASTWITALLVMALVTVSAIATLLEARNGPDYSQWYVYGSRWFLVLLGLLGANLLAATGRGLLVSRRRWSWQSISLFAMRVGLVLLVAGAIHTQVRGIRGQLVLRDAKGEHEFQIYRQSVIQIVHSQGERKIATELSFAPGPVDWPAATQLDFGESRGLGVKIVKFYRHATHYSTWVKDTQDSEGAALLLRLANGQGDVVQQDWLAGSAFGGEAVIGPTGYQFWPLSVASMLQDFLEPPTDGLGKKGILSMHYAGQMYRVSIDDHLGTRVPVGDTGIEVELVGYYPDARPAPQGGFYSRSERAKNPLLELKVHLKQGETISQIAFARRPLLTNDGVTGRVCPVRFWYHHPDLPPTPGAEFVQTPAGTLYCRTTINDRRGEPVQIHEGDQIPLGSQYSLTVVQYLPHARQDRGFRSQTLPRGKETGEEAAALLEVDYDGTHQLVWLKRDDPQYGFASMVTERGRVTLSFDYQKLSLPYGLRLPAQPRHSASPNSTDQAAGNVVEFVDDSGAVLSEHSLMADGPLTCGPFTLCRAEGDDAGQDAPRTVLSVTYDPGRWLKHAGACLLCGGMLIMFLRRGGLFGRPACLSEASHVSDSTSPSHDVERSTERGEARHVPKPLGLNQYRRSNADHLID